MRRLLPGQKVEDLVVSTVGRGRWSLAARRPRNFTMLLFYRGVHSAPCRAWLEELSRLREEFEARGVEAAAISMDHADDAARAVDDWNIEGFAMGHGLQEHRARRWGLYISTALDRSEPSRFCEPGLFLVRPTLELFYAAVCSAPFGRPSLREILDGIDFVLDNDYPARGGARPSAEAA